MVRGTTGALFLPCLVFLVSLASAVANVQDQCSGEFQKLSECLAYSTGKVDTPSDKCCSAVSDIRGRNPVCLCYIIQQTHKGSSAVTTYGLQFGRLLQLPAACKIANASVKECPKLLDLPPGSPDYALFNGSAPLNMGNTTATYSTGAGFLNQLHYSSFVAVAIVVAIVSSVF